MFNKIKPIIIFLLFAVISGCDLLGNQEPQQSIPYEGKFDTIQDFKNLVTGSYNSLQSYASTILYSDDIIADDAVFTGSFTSYKQIGDRSMTPTNYDIELLWEDRYSTINNTNIILENIGSLDDPSATQEELDNIRGEALFIRALEYYNLLKLFALPAGATTDDSHLGVPLQLEPIYSSDDFKNPSRSTVDEVYSQIDSDLKDVENLASPTNLTNRATPSAAVALRARIALIKHDYQKAADLSNQILDNDKFTLLNDVTSYFRDELGAESIFEIQNTEQDPGGGRINLSSAYNIDARDDIQINISFRDALNALINNRQQDALDAANATAIDTRKRDLINGKDDDGKLIVRDSRSSYGGGESNTFKYEDGINTSDNVPVLRYSEMILTRAESLAQIKGINKESIDLLNKIRERAFKVQNGNISLISYTAADFSSPEDLIDAIFLERRVELAFEGHRKVDLQRRRLKVRDLAWDADKLTFPIPQTQIDANKNIEQNPGYN